MSFKRLWRVWLPLFGVASTFAAQANGPWNKAYAAAAARGFANASGYADVGFAPALVSTPGKPFTATRTYTDKRKNANNRRQKILPYQPTSQSPATKKEEFTTRWHLKS